jgi:uncharacterized protein YjbI with pentapeptide repeats
MDDARSPIQRVNELSALARGAWFSLLTALAFIAVTLLSIDDGELVANRRTIDLPVIGSAVPSSHFLFLSAFLVTILYLNLHLYLTKLWQAFQYAPQDPEASGLLAATGGTRPGGSGTEARLADRVEPWLVNDYALSRKRGTRPRDHGRAWLRAALTVVTVWLAGPAVLVAIWIKVLHLREWGWSAVVLALVCATLLIGIHSLLEAEARLRHDIDRSSDPAGARRFARYNRRAFAAVGAVAVAAFLLTTRTPGPEMAQLRPALDIDNEIIAALPGGWQDGDSARESFRAVWCSLRGDVPGELCAVIPAETEAETRALLRQRVAYCAREKRLGRPGCAARFENLDRRFDAEWRAVRLDQLGRVPRIDLGGADLMGMSAEGAILVGADLHAADLRAARLPKAKLEGAQLIGANLGRVSAYYADLRFADLTSARAEPHSDAGLGPNLEGARLEGAVLYGAALPRARLKRARLAAADLGEADLSGADLREAQLHRARLDGAILTGADLRGATGLTQAQLATAVLDTATKLPRRPKGKELHGYGCLVREPVKLTGNAALAADHTRYRALVCPPGEPPRRVDFSATPTAAASQAPGADRL